MAIWQMRLTINDEGETVRMMTPDEKGQASEVRILSAQKGRIGDF